MKSQSKQKFQKINSFRKKIENAAVTKNLCCRHRQGGLIDFFSTVNTFKDRYSLYSVSLAKFPS